ncbi:MAG TPA: hypothetical protein VJN90_03205, partial [Candidatus Acidoferrales bacterium]|nr:hypothetical protein [Candidatus Acidoferrales bacterium]
MGAAKLFVEAYGGFGFMATCHNCGFKQPDGPKCVKCSSLFSYHAGESIGLASTPSTRSSASSRVASTYEVDSPSPRGLLARLRKGYSIFRWAFLAVLLIVVLLILHRAPPPQIPVDPQAAARAQSKFADAETAVQQHQPYQLTLDRTELNSYVNSTLQLPGHANPQAAASSSSPAASETS